MSKNNINDLVKKNQELRAIICSKRVSNKNLEGQLVQWRELVALEEQKKLAITKHLNEKVRELEIQRFETSQKLVQLEVTKIIGDHFLRDEIDSFRSRDNLSGGSDYNSDDDFWS